MIKLKINKEKKNPEVSFLIFKKASSFTLRKYREGFYFQKKKKKQKVFYE